MEWIWCPTAPIDGQKVWTEKSSEALDLLFMLFMPTICPEMIGGPIGVAKLKDLDRFDADFFNMNKETADGTDTQIRMLLELTYEAIVDSGIVCKHLTAVRIVFLKERIRIH